MTTSASASGGSSMRSTSAPRERRAPEARRLAVAEDGAEVVGRPLGHADRLGEEHGALAVVARGEVDQLHRHELRRCRTALALERGDELRPRRAHDERLEARVGRRRWACTWGTRRGARCRRGGAARDGTGPATAAKSGLPQPPSTHACRSRRTWSRYSCSCGNSGASSAMASTMAWTCARTSASVVTRQVDARRRAPAAGAARWSRRAGAARRGARPPPRRSVSGSARNAASADPVGRGSATAGGGHDRAR